MTLPLVHLNIGEMVIAEEPVIISTVLGSCVSVCIYSEECSSGGMIHYLLPTQQTGSTETDLKYGDKAIIQLLEELEELTSLPRTSFKAKIAGGAGPIGLENIKIAREMLKKNRIKVVGEDVGGTTGRKAHFHPHSGRLQIARLEEKKELNKLPTSLKKSPLNILIVDDSKTMRDLLAKCLADDPGFSIAGKAASAQEAKSILDKTHVDVMTLDIHMPGMDGVTFLEQLLPRKVIPTIMISSLNPTEGGEVMKALEIGAVDYIHKPSLSEIATFSHHFREKLLTASTARVKVRKHKTHIKSSFAPGDFDSDTYLIMGASTGGTEALKDVLIQFPANIPPIVIVQHIPPVFSKAFADRMNTLCPFLVKEAEDGDVVEAGKALIAPGGKQMKLVKKNGKLVVTITDDAPVNRHKPSVDYLFNSAAKLLGKSAVGVILTGMGADGAKGLLAMKKAGARTVGQNEESCVVYGMPKAAAELGAVDEALALEAIPGRLMEHMTKRMRKAN